MKNGREKMNILLIRDLSSHIRTIPLSEPLQIDMRAKSDEYSYVIKIQTGDIVLSVKLDWIGDAQAQNLFEYLYNKIREALLPGNGVAEISLIEVRAVFLTDKDSRVEVFEGREAIDVYEKMKAPAPVTEPESEEETVSEEE